MGSPVLLGHAGLQDLYLQHANWVAACGFYLVPWLGIKPRTPCIESSWSLSPWTTREVPPLIFFFFLVHEVFLEPNQAHSRMFLPKGCFHGQQRTWVVMALTGRPTKAEIQLSSPLAKMCQLWVACKTPSTWESLRTLSTLRANPLYRANRWGVHSFSQLWLNICMCQAVF